jgi:hypothetical protein
MKKMHASIIIRLEGIMAKGQNQRKETKKPKKDKK